GAGNQAHCRVAHRSRIAIALVEAKIDCSADNERVQVLVGIVGRNRHDSEHIEYGKRLGIVHYRKIDQLFDLAPPEPRPYSLVLSPRFQFGRSILQVDSFASQAFQARGDRPVALSEHGVQVYAPSRYGTSFNGAARMRLQAR